MYVLLCKGAKFFRDLGYMHFGDLAIPRSFLFHLQVCKEIFTQEKEPSRALC